MNKIISLIGLDLPFFEFQLWSKLEKWPKILLGTGPFSFLKSISWHFSHWSLFQLISRRPQLFSNLEILNNLLSARIHISIHYWKASYLPNPVSTLVLRGLYQFKASLKFSSFSQLTAPLIAIAFIIILNIYIYICLIVLYFSAGCFIHCFIFRAWHNFL